MVANPRCYKLFPMLAGLCLLLISPGKFPLG